MTITLADKARQNRKAALAAVRARHNATFATLFGADRRSGR